VVRKDKIKKKQAKKTWEIRLGALNPLDRKKRKKNPCMDKQLREVVSLEQEKGPVYHPK